MEIDEDIVGSSVQATWKRSSVPFHSNEGHVESESVEVLKHSCREKQPQRETMCCREVPETNESVDDFVTLSRQRQVAWQSTLHLVLKQSEPAAVEPKVALDSLASDLRDMEADLARASYFLPAYDQRALAATYKDLSKQLDAARSQLCPRKKFSFGSQRVARAKAAAAVQAVPVGSKQDSENARDEGMPSVTDGRGVQGARGETVVVDLRRLPHGDYTLADLEDCEVFLLGSMSALRCHKLARCRLYAGPVAGSAFVDLVSGCDLHIAAHQVRIHAAENSDLYLAVRSNPIIEHSTGIRVAPYGFPPMVEAVAAAGLGRNDTAVEGKWREVNDFGWLRATPSPNWSVLPEALRKAPPSPPSDCRFDASGISVVSKQIPP